LQIEQDVLFAYVFLRRYWVSVRLQCFGSPKSKREMTSLWIFACSSSVALRAVDQVSAISIHLSQ